MLMKRVYRQSVDGLDKQISRRGDVVQVPLPNSGAQNRRGFVQLILLSNEIVKYESEYTKKVLGESKR